MTQNGLKWILKRSLKSWQIKKCPPPPKLTFVNFFLSFFFKASRILHVQVEHYQKKSPKTINPNQNSWACPCRLRVWSLFKVDFFHSPDTSCRVPPGSGGDHSPPTLSSDRQCSFLQIKIVSAKVLNCLHLLSILWRAKTFKFQSPWCEVFSNKVNITLVIDLSFMTWEKGVFRWIYRGIVMLYSFYLYWFSKNAINEMIQIVLMLDPKMSLQQQVVSLEATSFAFDKSSKDPTWNLQIIK